MSQEAQKVAEKQVPLIVVYHNQLALFKKERDDMKVKFHQLEGAIFACENMIKQYEESAKQAALDLAKKSAESKEALMSNEDNGDVNDGKSKKAS